MLSDKGIAQLGFQIKWGNKRLEYFGVEADFLQVVLQPRDEQPNTQEP